MTAGERIAAWIANDADAGEADYAARIDAAIVAAESSALERAAQWHEDRAARVERESPSLGSFLSDADRDYIAKRAKADRDDAKELRALASPAAAPAAKTHAPYCCADAKAGGPDHSVDCPHFAVPSTPDLRGALVEAREALEQVWAAIGDRLCGDGPLSKEYAHGVTRKVNAALEQIRFTLAIPAPPSDPVAPSLLPRVLAALETEAAYVDDASRETCTAEYLHALAAELRRYIAEGEGKT